MEHLDALTKAAVAAVPVTADRLGVDPLIVAEWLKRDQLLANVTFLLGQQGMLTEHRIELEAMLLDFRELVHRDARRRRVSCPEVS